MAGKKRKRENARTSQPLAKDAANESPQTGAEDAPLPSTAVKLRCDAPADLAVALHVYTMILAGRHEALALFAEENTVPWSVMVDGRSLLAYALENEKTDFDFLRRSGAIQRETLLATSRRRRGVSATNAWCAAIAGPDEECFVDALAAVEPLDCLQVFERDPEAPDSLSPAERALTNLADAGDRAVHMDFDSRVERVLKKLPSNAPVTNLDNVMAVAYSYRRGKTLTALAARLPAFDPRKMQQRSFADIGASVRWFNKGYCSEEYAKTVYRTFRDWNLDYHVDLASLMKAQLPTLPVELITCIVWFIRDW